MAKIEHFEDLQCWQKARQLANMVYDRSEHPRFAKDFSQQPGSGCLRAGHA